MFRATAKTALHILCQQRNNEQQNTPNQKKGKKKVFPCCHPLSPSKHAWPAHMLPQKHVHVHWNFLEGENLAQHFKRQATVPLPAWAITSGPATNAPPAHVAHPAHTAHDPVIAVCGTVSHVLRTKCTSLDVNLHGISIAAHMQPRAEHHLGPTGRGLV